jgi:hypothetical protein
MRRGKGRASHKRRDEVILNIKMKVSERFCQLEIERERERERELGPHKVKVQSN